MAVYEFEYCYTFSWGVPDSGMECCSNCASSGPLGFGIDDEAFVKGGVVYASKVCCSDFEAEFLG